MQDTMRGRGRGRGRGRVRVRGRGRGIVPPSPHASVQSMTNSSRFRSSGRVYDTAMDGYYDDFNHDDGYRWFEGGGSPRMQEDPRLRESGADDSATNGMSSNQSFEGRAPPSVNRRYDDYYQAMGYDVAKRHAHSGPATGNYDTAGYMTQQYSNEGGRNHSQLEKTSEKRQDGRFAYSERRLDSDRAGKVPDNWRYQDSEKRDASSRVGRPFAPGRVFERRPELREHSEYSNTFQNENQDALDGHSRKMKTNKSPNIDKRTVNPDVWRSFEDEVPDDEDKWKMNHATSNDGDSNGFGSPLGLITQSYNSRTKDCPEQPPENEGRILSESHCAEGTTRVERFEEHGARRDDTSEAIATDAKSDFFEKTSFDVSKTNSGRTSDMHPVQTVQKGTEQSICDVTGTDSTDIKNPNSITEMINQGSPQNIARSTGPPCVDIISPPVELNLSRPVSSIVSEIVAQMKFSKRIPIVDPETVTHESPKANVVAEGKHVTDGNGNAGNVVVEVLVNENGEKALGSMGRSSDYARSDRGSRSSESIFVTSQKVQCKDESGTEGASSRNKDSSSSSKAEAGQALSIEVLNAVVKVYSTHCEPNYSLPWQMRRQTQTTSSGFVLSGRSILTSAHAVERCTVVTVKKRGGDRKYIAQVLAAGHECELALLTVPDEEFWCDMKPLHFGTSPELQTSIFVAGYPNGGERISITQGAVSRVEIQDYGHGANQLLGIKIDAALDNGSSGGPALNLKNEVVGIAIQMSSTDDSEKSGYLVSRSVIDHFVLDYQKNGKYTGFCHCAFQWQQMENKCLRNYMKMKDGESGILVRRVYKTSDAFEVLRRGDVITKIDGQPMSNDGTVPYRAGERISFHYIITTKFTGEELQLEVLRDGCRTNIKYRLGESAKNLLVPVHDDRRYLEYFTIAGIVFVTLSEPYLFAEYGDKWDMKAPVRLLERLMYGLKETSDEQIVILSQVLNAEINTGYEFVINSRVHKFNDICIRNLAHLAQLVDVCTDEYFRFDLDDEIVVVNREEALKTSAVILESHGIPSAYCIGSLEIHA